MVDLHLHSVYSDGTSRPGELVSQGISLGLRALALTDHDTVDGVDELVAAAREQSMDVLPGVELSAGICPLSRDHQREIHILGYFPEWTPEVRAKLEPLRLVQKWREERNRAMVNIMRSYCMPIEYEELVKEAGTSNVGRPHFADWLIRHGYVQSVGEAFQQFLVPSALTYVDRRTFNALEAVNLIREAGGVAVLAHPKALHIFSDADFEKFLKWLVDMGLEGIEVYCSVHLRADIRRYERMAQKFGLLMTGGTDFHGRLKPDIRMGYGFGYTKVEDGVYERLLERLRGARK